MRRSTPAWFATMLCLGLLSGCRCDNTTPIDTDGGASGGGIGGGSGGGDVGGGSGGGGGGGSDGGEVDGGEVDGGNVDGGNVDGGNLDGGNLDGGNLDGGNLDGGSTSSLSIVTTALPGGQVGVAYSQAVVAGGGTTPYAWTLGGGVLPAGLTLASDGTIAGTPTAAGSFSFTLRVVDSSSSPQVLSQPYTIAILPPAAGTLVVTTTSLPNGIVSVAYGTSLTAGGGTQPLTWTVSAGSLPPGITLAAGGTLSGTPSVAGTSTFTVTVTDSGTPAQTASASFGITVLANSGSLQVSTASLPGGTAGSAYSASFAAAGGASPYTWGIASGLLPPGLVLSSSGALSGTPTTVGSYTFVVQVADASSPQQRAQKQFTVAIGTAPLSITTTSLPNGTVNRAYNSTVAANGGATPYSFSVSLGTLPPGLTLDSSTGAIAGTPITAGGSSFTIQAADSSSPQKTAAQAYSVTISAASAALTITTTTLPEAVRTVSYSTQLTGSGGTLPYTWSIQAGALPGGLALNASTGVISGTPTATGSFSFTIRLVDSNAPVSNMASAPFTLVVRDPLQITTANLADAVVGAAYSASVTASGGLSPYVFSVSSGSLPPGLSLSSAGAIIGTPTTTGSYGFAVQVTDSGNPRQTTTRNLSIAVTATLAIATSALPGASVGVGYSQTLLASGGASPYAWTVTGGALPAGLGLNATTGVLSGTPSSAGTFNFTVQVTDVSSPQQAATKALSIVVTGSSALTVATTSLPGAVVGKTYSTSLTAVGGTSPYVWSISAGTLPGGLSLSSTTGAITGTPTGAATSSFTVQVTDASSPQQTATQALSIVVTAPLVVTTNALPGGVTGSVYIASLSASGGTTPYNWSISAGALPPGLSLSTATGAISGTPTSAGSFAFTVSVVDNSNPQQAASATLSIAITAALTITTASLPSGTVSQPYSATVGASGGASPYAFSVSAGALPTGLTLSGTTGAITGTPSAAGSFTFTITVTDASSPMQTASKSYTVLINPPGTLTITTTSLVGGVVGSAYNATVAASGGTTPYAWSVSVGSLPPGLTINAATGAITGTPTSAGSFTFTLQVTDASSPMQTATRQFTISILAQLAVTTTSLPGAVVNQAYSTSLAAAGGTTPYTYSISAGTLPLGLSLNTTTGVISGTPSLAGTSNFTVRVLDSSSPQQAATKALSIVVVSALSVTTTSLPAGTVSGPYSTTLAASGGTTPYSWAVTSGALPAGLTLNFTNGQISGTPTTAGTFSFTVTATDSSNPVQTASKSLSIVINPPLTVTTAALPDATVALSYSANLTASGGVAPYNWSVSVGSLPPGLTLAAPTGAITGTPSTAGTYSFTVQVSDSSTPQQTATRPLSILVKPAGSLAITTSILSDAVKGTAYSATLAATGGTTPYTWSVSVGALPSGLALNASTGVISGTPTASGAFSFTATVTDASSPQGVASRALSIKVSDPLVITTASLPGAITATAYSATLTGSGGATPYAWSISAGTLPAGVTLDGTTGTISGTPTVAGTSNFTVRLVDTSNPQQAATRALSITVTAKLTITTMTLPPGTLNMAYSSTVAVTGGTTPRTFSISAGALPPGLSLNATTGNISGMSGSRGMFTFTVLVVDSGSPQQSASRQYTIQIF